MTGRRVLVLALSVAVVLAGCSMAPGQGTDGSGESEQDARIAFTDVTAESGLDYRATGSGVGNGNSGVYAADVDRDSWTDLLVVGGDAPVLFANDGGTFERTDALPAVNGTVKSASFVDVERDGYPDLLLFTAAGDVVSLHNEAGRFERADYGLGNLTYPLGATAADYDRDGDTDLFVYQSGDWRDRKPAGYFQTDGQLETDNGNPNYLYENVGGEFQRADTAGIRGEHWSLAASFVDLTGDGHPDVHVANDYDDDTLYVNRGDGTFERRSLGGATARNGMASEVADVTGDGAPDVFVSNIWFPDLRSNMSQERYERIERLFRFVVHSGRTKGNTLLVNEGGGSFEDRADALGVRHGGWGWAATATDLDNDGDRDLVHTTQRVVRVDRDDPVYTYPMVFQRGPEGFDRVPREEHGLGETNGRGLVALDFDHDGAQELVVATYDSDVTVYDEAGDRTNAAVQFRVVDDANATALGAVVRVQAGDTEQVVRQTANVDYLSQEPRVEHVGVGTHETVTLVVTWPDGTTRTFEDVETGRRLRLTRSGSVVVTTLDADR